MSNQIASPKKTSALAVMAERVNVDPTKLYDTLKNTVFKKASDDELLALVVVANEYNLNPLTRELYAFPAKGGGIVPVVSVDGWNNIANSHPQLDGFEFEFEHGKEGALISCACTVHRKDRGHPVRVTEYLSECRRDTEPWKMEHRMLRHKAFIQACRMAFGFSGIHDEDEAERIVSGKVVDGDSDSDVMIAALAKEEPVKAEPEELTLGNDLTVDEQIHAKARYQGISVEVLIVDAAEAGHIREKPLKDLTNDEKKTLLSL